MIRACNYTTYDYIGGKHVESEQKHGFFHKWGTRIEEYDNGGCQETVAIIENSSGVVEITNPVLVKFLDLKANIIDSSRPA